MTVPGAGASSDIGRVLGLDRRSTRRRYAKLLIGAAIASALIAAAVAFLLPDDGSATRFVTAEARRGSLTITVTATGQLEPVNQVEVGTEISGTIETVEVHDNARVKAGQVLARLDTDQLEARLRQSQAALELARARVKEAEATVVETRNALRRAQELAKAGICPPQECEAAEAAYARAEAAPGIARAQVTQATAQRDADRTTLSKAVILSPISGLVLKRQVEPGQTVAATLQTRVLFILAEDLSKMELHVAVDEADVGQVREGQRAVFTVDAYPDRVFPAVITRVRYAPETVEGVVTYQAVLYVDNADLALRPGMTARADITVREIEDALLVPNAALRFTPPEAAVPAADRDGGLLGRLLPGPPRPPSAERRRIAPADRRQQRVWTLRDGEPVAVPVTVGATDGEMSEVVAGEVTPGLPLLVDTASVAG